MPDNSEYGPRSAEWAETVRRRATRIVLSLLLAGVLAATIFLQGNPAQPTVLLGLFAGCGPLLYLIEVWARTTKDKQ